MYMGGDPCEEFPNMRMKKEKTNSPKRSFLLVSIIDWLDAQGKSQKKREWTWTFWLGCGWIWPNSNRVLGNGDVLIVIYRVRIRVEGKRMT
jgi:hypothetical protein